LPIPVFLFIQNKSLNDFKGRIGRRTVWLIDAEADELVSKSINLVPVWALSLAEEVSIVTVPVLTQGASDPVSNPGFCKSCISGIKNHLMILFNLLVKEPTSTAGEGGSLLQKYSVNLNGHYPELLYLAKPTL